VQSGIASLAAKMNNTPCRWLEDELAEDESDMPPL
jgi:hypothetical protein